MLKRFVKLFFRGHATSERLVDDWDHSMPSPHHRQQTGDDEGVQEMSKQQQFPQEEPLRKANWARTEH